MEKRPYSVEWLSESSLKNPAATITTTTTTTLLDMDFLRSRMDQAYPYGMQSTIPLPSGMERSTGGIGHTEKENRTDNKIALNQASTILQDTDGVSVSRKALQEVSPQKPGSAQVECRHSDSDSIKSPGSMSEDEPSSRSRTKFTTEQLQELEKSFRDHRYIGSSEKKRLSKELKLSENQIKTWFQNRRMKFKRQSQDARVEAFFTGLYLPYYKPSDLKLPSYSVQPDLPIPLPPIHPYGPPPPAVLGPTFNAPPVVPTSLGSYPCPPMLVHPMINDPMSHRFPPY